MNTLDRCLRAGNQLTVHENGFLTIALPHDIDGRLHLWGETVPWDEWLNTPERTIISSMLIPRQRVFTPIHDHTFGMTSQVLGGSIIDTRWVVAKLAGNGDTVWGPYRPHSPNGEGKLVPTTHCGANILYLKQSHRERHEAGDLYNVPVGALHWTQDTGPAATLMLRTRYPHLQTDTRPTVMVPEDQDPDNEFRRDGFNYELLVALAREIFLYTAT